jgi:hypothetical protein
MVMLEGGVPVGNKEVGRMGAGCGGEVVEAGVATMLGDWLGITVRVGVLVTAAAKTVWVGDCCEGTAGWRQLAQIINGSRPINKIVDLFDFMGNSPVLKLGV